MTKQHHYTTEAEILAVIDECIHSAKLAELEGIFHEKMAAKYLKDSRTASNGHAAFLIEQSSTEQSKAEKLYRRSERILENRIPSLKRTLAAFRTQPLGNLLGGDTSVVLEK